MDRRRSSASSTSRRSSSGGKSTSSRRAIPSAAESRGSKQKQGFSPKTFAVIAAIAVALICTPLLLLAFSAESPEEQLENLYNTTAEELGLSAATAKVAVLDVTVPEPTPTDPDAFIPSGNFLYEQGMTDEAMHTVQARLMQFGYMVTSNTTDYFGPATKDAIELLQTRYGLAITGGIDQQTYDQLFSDSMEKYVAAMGTNGSDVAQIQSLLKKLGYFTGTATGYYGSETANAVKMFQSANGLKADGSVGIETLQKLKSSGAIAYVPPSPTPTPSDAIPPEGQTAAPTEAPVTDPPPAEETPEPGMP